MKKYIPFIIIVVLVAIIAVGGTYIVMKDKTNNQNNVNEPQESTNQSNQSNQSNNNYNQSSGIESANTEESSSNIIQTYNVRMNNKNISFKINYKYENDSNEYEYVKGIMGGKEVYRKLDALEGDIKNSKKSQNFTKNAINSKFSKDNFKIIKGTEDKDYLLVHIYLETPTGSMDKLLVYNDNMEQIDIEKPMGCEEEMFTIFTETNSVEVKENPWYENQFKTKSNSNIQVKVDNNQIYYLAPVFKNGDPEQGTLEERIYTISNDKLT